ncbi:MAG: alpha-mannosidase [Iphinoe sp. HA4291-MV1]|jgi:alpha-mannosidase|nr:alpha-mannosidase [Iphinoe sp. HA4291-MV1]
MDNSQISQAIERFRQMARLNVHSSWRYCFWDAPDANINLSTEFLNWSIAETNAKEHITIPAGGQVVWLAQQFVIPQNLQGYPLTDLALRLVLTWWAQDVKIFVNGSLLQEGDLYDASTRALLSPSVKPGEEIVVALRLVSPDSHTGALMRSHLVYESTSDDRLDPGFVADELDILQRYLETFAPEKLDSITAAVALIDWTALPDGQTFERSLATLRQNLTAAIGELPQQQRRILLLGHSHLDMAWLWPINETWEVAQRTFESVLKLQQEFPNLIYCHSSPALYAWIEQHRPDLFAAIQQAVALGRWEVVAGMWVEPDLNLINGESIVRQILYAQRYVHQKFGHLSTVVWLPDTFGFCATLPQMLKQGGIEYFVTQKLSWNDTTKFPYEVFWWRSPDGTQIFSFMSNAIGESIDPIKMANYAIDWEKQTGLKDALWLFGCGDHGGGPTHDMLEVARQWQKSHFFPAQKYTTASAYLQQISGLESALSNQQSFPVWNDELYLEFHRGCYTTHGLQKRWNRHCEGLLYQAELFASLATLSAGIAYPKAELEDAWKKVLFNQFHDILPGTSIPPVYVEANQAWQEVDRVGSEILERSKRAIASQIAFPPPPQPDALPIIVFNSLNWQRSEVVAVPLPTSSLESEDNGDQSWEIYDLEGHKLLSQLSEASVLLFLANDIPSVGYRVFWLCRQQVAKSDTAVFASRFDLKGTEIPQLNIRISLLESDSDNEKTFTRKDWILENEFLRVIVDFKSGEFSSIFDKVNETEIVNKEKCNQLQAFQDSGQYWDAWNIDPNYAKYPLPPTHLKSIRWVEQGPVQQRLRVVRQLGKSEFCQDYILSMGSPVLKIVTTVDWQERHVLVKAAFPLNLEADYATYEIPCGAIGRPTQPKEAREQAKWEVPALRWADLSTLSIKEKEGEGTDFSESKGVGYGVSLLNDCKYGYDSQSNQLRLTLLRSPDWPTPEADRGNHEFTYALYPHTSSWQSANTVRRGYELNLPLQVIHCPTLESTRIKPLPPVSQFLDLSAQNLVLMAFKQSEDDPQQWILRCYECHGEPAQLSLQSDLGLVARQTADILERLTQTSEQLIEEKTFSVFPWKLLTLYINLARS